jgi:hypothetical protein
MPGSAAFDVKSVQPDAKKALAEIGNAEDRQHAPEAVTAFEAAYGTKFPRPSRRSSTTLTSYWRSTTTRPSIVAVSTVPDTGCGEWWPEFDHREIVATTLVQQPRYVDCADGAGMPRPASSQRHGPRFLAWSPR